ncbi:MAG: CBS protein [uncultured bacterium]|nr:MAG: CBS protein [uncultured bacterium]
MPKAYDKITTIMLLPKSHFVQPPKVPELIHLHDPALSIMINLEHRPASHISVDDHITDTLLVEKVGKEHLLFVLDEDNTILGIVTAEDIHGEKPYQIIQEKRIKRHEITVKMVMTPFDRTLCLEMEYLRHAKVSNIIATLIESKEHYALVVEKNANNTAHVVKGFFWASLIGHALGSDITGTKPSAQSIAELQREFRF